MDPRGKLLREKRLEKGLTTHQLAAIAGVDNGTISRLENGKMPNASFVLMAKLARVLEISLDELAEPQPV